jgi:predicted AAA+ superfamily ATPase
MIERALGRQIHAELGIFPVVALVGPRQVGKTTLALQLSGSATKPAQYLDLERPSDLARLHEPELYLRQQAGKLVVLDEVQRLPQVFPLLRSLVDERRRGGERAGHFLILGSASPDLLRQSSESLAGRIACHELQPFAVDEIAGRAPLKNRDRQWERGGFPESFLAAGDEVSWRWREQFLLTYLERDIAQFAPRLPAVLLRRLWTMLCHQQGGLLNAAQLAASLGVTGKTVTRYVDLLTDLFLVRQLAPWFRNIGKRLVKAPKVYVRDSGLVHALANIRDHDTLLGHPLCGPSWEGFVIENLLTAAPATWRPFFFRTGAGAEIDLVLERPDGTTIALEIKRTLRPVLGRGFCLGCADVRAQERYYVVPDGPSFPLDKQTIAVSLAELLAQFRAET